MIEKNNSFDGGFAARLQALIGDGSVSAFARKVGLSDSLVRRYLAGAEPGLGRALQIARATNSSLEWLAGAQPLRGQPAEGVDMPSLEAAMRLASQVLGADAMAFDNGRAMKLVVASYQYLRASRQPDGSFDENAARSFTEYVADMCGLRTSTQPAG